MRMYINGQWIDKAETIPVFNPFDQSVLDTGAPGHRFRRGLGDHQRRARSESNGQVDRV